MLIATVYAAWAARKADYIRRHEERQPDDPLSSHVGLLTDAIAIEIGVTLASLGVGC